MRKIFSLIAAVLFAGSMFAAVETVDFSAQGYENAQAIASYEGTNFTVTFDKGTNSNNAPKYYTTGTAIRCYGGNTLTVASASTISQIVLTFASGEGSNEITANPGTFATDTWTGSANSVVLTISGTSGHRRIKTMAVTYGGSTPQPVVEYYVVGSMNNWELNADYKLAANPGQAGEFMKRFTFAANDELKVRKAIDGVLDAWYPEGMGNNWIITADGDYDVYFRPEGNTEWANGFFFVAPYVAPAIPQYEVATAIAAGLTDGTEIQVRGIVTKMELKGTNFKKYGSVNIYVADATGAEGQFEFYNCYSMNADTFKVTVPASAAESTTFVEVTEVSDANGYAIHVGDTVVAQGKYKLYSGTHELNTGCYIVYAKAPGAEFPTNIENAATEQKAIKFFENGQLLINKNGVIYNAQGAVVR